METLKCRFDMIIHNCRAYIESRGLVDAIGDLAGALETAMDGSDDHDYRFLCMGGAITLRQLAEDLKKGSIRGLRKYNEKWFGVDFDFPLREGRKDG